MVSTHRCTFVRLAQMLMNACVTIEQSSTRATQLGGGSPLSFGFLVVRAVILHASWAVVRIVGAGMLIFIVVRFQTKSTEIAGGKVAGQTGDDVIMVTIVQEHKLFVLG